MIKQVQFCFIKAIVKRVEIPVVVLFGKGDIMSQEAMENMVQVILERNNQVVINSLESIIEFLDMDRPDLARTFILGAIEILRIGEEE
jgi:hypothetical protein